jgi:hypothetical protein
LVGKEPQSFPGTTKKAHHVALSVKDNFLANSHNSKGQHDDVQQNSKSLLKPSWFSFKSVTCHIDHFRLPHLHSSEDIKGYRLLVFMVASTCCNILPSTCSISMVLTHLLMVRGLARCLSGAHPAVRMALIRYDFYCIYSVLFL